MLDTFWVGSCSAATVCPVLQKLLSQVNARKIIVIKEMVALVICALPNAKQQLCSVCLPTLTTFIHFTIIGHPIWRTLTPHLVATFGRFHGHVLLHCISALETYHCHNGLLTRRMVAGSPSCSEIVGLILCSRSYPGSLQGTALVFLFRCRAES